MRTLRQRLPSPNSLVAFEAAARLLSFTAAADELNVTQGAVSRQVHQLERFLGLALFARGHRSIHLTTEGRRLQQAVTLGLEHIAGAVSEIRTNRSAPEVTVATTLAFASMWLMPHLPTFRRLHPEYEVRVLAADAEPDFARDGMDIAIRYGDGRWAGSRTAFLFDERIYPVCSPGYLNGRHLHDLRSLLDETLLHLDGDGWRWTTWADWFKAKGVNGLTARRGLRLNNYPLMIQAAKAGQGIGLGWHHLIHDDLRLGSLVCPLDEVVTTDQATYLAWPEHIVPTPAVEAFCAWIVEEARASREVQSPNREHRWLNETPMR